MEQPATGLASFPPNPTAPFAKAVSRRVGGIELVDILQGQPHLIGVAGLEPVSPPKAVRLAQGRLGDQGVIDDPLAPDWAAGSTTSREVEVGA